ncbi:MAG: enolase C-terminal domain-like protein [Haloarculaceae archaeon]
MRIAELEIHEFAYELDDVGVANGHQVYAPGETLAQPGFVLTVRTADGLEGHYRGIVFVPPMVTQVSMAAGRLLGRDPLEREGIWQDLWTGLRHTDHLGLGPIDVALWDLAGKHYGAPVSELLGGYRTEIPAYASTYFMDEEPDGLSSPEAVGEFARECRDAGYGAFKLHGDPAGDPDRDVAACEAAREAAPDLDLMLDPSSEYDTYGDALRVGRALDDLDFRWYEDPTADAGQSLQGMERLTRALDTPVLGAEHVRTGPFGHADHLVSGACDLVRADVHLDGGVTGALKMARAAESLGADVELHLGGPATLHCLSAVRNAGYFERGLLHPQDLAWMSDQGFTSSPEAVTDGTVTVPDGPGLGVEVDWSFVERRQTGHALLDGSGASGLA